MLARDRGRWPGGKMAGFMIWISKAWGEFWAPQKRPDIVTAEDHQRFEFLTTYRGKVQPWE
jgi:hypothetical protein